MSEISLDRREQKKLGVRLPKLAKLFASRETEKEYIFELRVPKTGRKTYKDIHDS